MNHETYFQDIGAWPRSQSIRRVYVLGFILSLALTLAAYFLVDLHVRNEHIWPSHTLIVPLLALFALAQFALQLVYFLHLGKDSASRERLVVLGFAGVIVSILLGGSLWIMSDLNGRMMLTPAQMEQYMQKQIGL